MAAALQTSDWHGGLPTASFPTPLTQPEPNGAALALTPPPEPPSPTLRGRSRLFIPALLLVGWGGLFAYCAAYLREDLPFRPSAATETAHNADEPTRRVFALPDVPPEAAPAMQAQTSPPAAEGDRPAAVAVAVPVPPKRISPVPAVAEYVGVWGPNTDACLSPTRRRGYLPATISADKARAGKTICTFHDSHRTGNTWLMAADCVDRGRRWSSQVRLLVEGDRLTWTSSRGASTYVRCGRRAG